MDLRWIYFGVFAIDSISLVENIGGEENSLDNMKGSYSVSKFRSSVWQYGT